MYNKRAKLYLQQRGFAFAATRAYKATYNDALETNDLLRALGGYKCSLYSAQYASFIHGYKLERSLKSLKLFFLEIEAGVYENTIPQDEDTVAMAIDRIVWREEENKRGRKRKQQSPRKNQRCNKKTPLLPTPSKQQPTQLSTNMTLHTMMKTNIEALKHQCSTVLSTEDYMAFIFGNKQIQDQFHRYIAVLMSTRQDGQKYVKLEQEIGQRTLLMDRIKTLPRPGQTFILPDFNKDTFIAPCTRGEYVNKYCTNVDFRIPPSRETLTLPPRHPGLYTTTPMLGVRQIDPACRTQESYIRIPHYQRPGLAAAKIPEYKGRGTKITRPSSI